MDVSRLQDHIEAYLFTDIHPNVRFGTASDRYAGWIGQIYPDFYGEQIKSRTRALGGQRFEERTVPVSSVADYFGHFGVLELDFTFYRPLLEPDASPTNNMRVLYQYAEHAPAEARFFLKAPQQYFVPRLRRQRAGEKPTYEENPQYLDASAYTATFLQPAIEVLGDRLAGVIFEQSYQRVSDTPPLEVVLADLDGFFEKIPPTVQSHIELRSPHLLTASYFDWLATRQIGHVFSHWTWLPAIREQWQRCGGQLTAADKQIITRLLTPLRMPYAKAYAQAYPFDKPLEAIVNSKEGHDMVLDVTALAFQAEQNKAILNVIANNRAWGNAPALSQAIARRIVDELVRRTPSE